MPTINEGELSKLYYSAEEVDRFIFAEQRSNVLLAIGDHYNRRFSRFFGRLRDNRQITEDQRLRIVKNHIYRVTRIYINNIVTMSPGVAIMPQRENELQDQKTAELNNSVWQDIKDRHNFSEKVRQWADDFIVIGEVWVKVFWDPHKGKFLGYEQEKDDDGKYMYGADKEPLPSKRPVFRGDISYDRIYGFNMLRDPNEKEAMEGYKIIRKMVSVKGMQAIYAGDEEKQLKIQGSTQNTYTVFEGSTGNFYQTREQTMLFEHFYPPSKENPMGFYHIRTELGMLEEGELPNGMWPICHTGFDEIQTTPRRRSIIKQLRAPQAEINRVASQIATHQITIGDDKILVQAGSKVTQGGLLPGVRIVRFSGVPPQYFPGRSGDHYLPYLESQIREIYMLANLQDDYQGAQGSKQAKADMTVELMKSVKQKKYFSTYAEKFERFLVDIARKSLEIARFYYPDDMLIPAIGRNEYVNIDEFRHSEESRYRIKLEPQVEDYETKMGKHITLTNAMQYMGSNIDKSDAGRILRAMPYTNKEQIFTDWTTDYDNVVNDILALDRGEIPPLHEQENHTYVIERLVHRTKQPDFVNLDPQIQENYKSRIQVHEQVKAKQLQAMKDAQSEFIPASGALVKADLYVNDPNSPTKSSRAKVPADALQWLLNKLAAQGTNFEELERLQNSAASNIAQQFLEGTRQTPEAAPQYEGPTLL